MTTSENGTTPAYTVAADRDWVATVRQALPSSRRVLASLRPTWELPGVFAIDAAFLRAAGVRALIWDVDGTITARHGVEPAPEARVAFERLLDAPLRHLILSNCGEERFCQLGTIFPGVPIVKGYHAGDHRVFRILHDGGEKWSSPPAGPLRPIRKPDPDLVEFAVRTLGEADRTAVALVGDQYLTDVASANLAGIRSIKVPTLARSSFPRSVRVLQWVDQWVYRLTV